MNLETILFGMEYLIIAMLLFVLVFTLGIVWRTEKQLDHAYKFFCLAIITLMGGKVLALGVFRSIPDPVFWIRSAELAAAFFFLLSVLEMRDIVRRLDHEKKS